MTFLKKLTLEEMPTLGCFIVALIHVFNIYLLKLIELVSHRL